jgi:hypothetical protein
VISALLSDRVPAADVRSLNLPAAWPKQRYVRINTETRRVMLGNIFETRRVKLVNIFEQNKITLKLAE